MGGGGVGSRTLVMVAVAVTQSSCQAWPVSRVHSSPSSRRSVLTMALHITCPPPAQQAA